MESTFYRIKKYQNTKISQNGGYLLVLVFSLGKINDQDPNLYGEDGASSICNKSAKNDCIGLR